MYVDGWMLFAIYFIAVLALAVSAYSLWSLEEIRSQYSKKTNRPTGTRAHDPKNQKHRSTAKGHFDNIYR